MRYISIILITLSGFTAWSMPEADSSKIWMQEIEEIVATIHAHREEKLKNVWSYVRRHKMLADKIHSRREIARALLTEVYVYQNLDTLYHQQITSLLKARDIFSGESDDWNVALCNLELGMALKEIQSDHALHMLRTALRYFRSAQDSIYIAQTLTEIGLYYRNYYDVKGVSLDSCAYYYQHALQYTKHGKIYCKVLNNQADLFLTNPYKNLEKTIALSRQILDEPSAGAANRAVAYLNMAIAYQELGTDSLVLLEKGYALTKNIRPLRLYYAASALLASYYTRHHQHARAEIYQYQNNQKKVAEKNNTLLMLLLETQTHELQLTQQINNLQQAALTRNKYIMLAGVACILILTALVTMIVQKNKIIKRDNIALATKNEQIHSLNKEIHHRVKNNLQIIVSLLELQQTTLTNQVATAVLKDITGRIRSIAFVHQKLYKSDTNQINIGFKSYAEDLCENLLLSYGKDDLLKVTVDIDEIEISIEKAITLGLIINELVTNSIKHAFVESGKGTIQVRLKKKTDQIQLDVNDNGIGLPEGFSLNLQSQSLGVDLVQSLVSKLKGKVYFRNQGGTMVNIMFPFEKN